MSLHQIVESAEMVRDEYAALHEESGLPQWGAAEYAQGFVGDVGDLMKLMMAKNGFRSIEYAHDRLAHELCDCLWSILILAREYQVDLEKEFPVQMEALARRIRAKRASNS